ncbi:MAG: membrane protein insertase YidC [Candidatus Eisenbacteria bacterium]|nr:membrane protein insertase YidC [Candidatus Eisenbacteria bacterium]
MDRRTLLAVALALVVFAAFTALQARYGPKPVRKPAADSTLVARDSALADTTAAAAIPNGSAGATAAPGAPGLAATPAKPAAPEIPEQRYVIETPLYRAEFSNRGARLTGFQLRKFAAAYGASDFQAKPAKRPRPGMDVPAGDQVRLDGAPTFALDLGSGESARSLAKTMFAASESTDATGAIRTLTFTGRDAGGMQIRQTWRVRPDSYMLDLEVETSGIPANSDVRDYSLTMRSWLPLTESDPQTDLHGLRATSLVGKDLHRDAAAGLVGRNPKVFEGVARWAGVQSRYFMALVGTTGPGGKAAVSAAASAELPADRLALMPAGTKPLAPVAIGSLVMPLPASGAGVQQFVAYVGPADHFALAKESGPLEMERSVDLGWRWIVPFSKLLLQLMRAVDGVVHNYGITILLIATLVRLLLHPMNMAGMRSMRAMQKLQPEIERIRKKFENDPKGLNAATMALYSENKVNPMGGCLPMLLQMPLFFALYAVINNAIDLRQAPFFGWIHDLSSPDLVATLGPLPVIGHLPVRFLPLLMAGTGLLSQVLTPTDPKQAPTMYLMNIFMLFIFYNLPSGLVFYWTVMNVLTAAQQWLAMRGDSGAVVVPAAAGKGRRP